MPGRISCGMTRREALAAAVATGAVTAGGIAHAAPLADIPLWPDEALARQRTGIRRPPPPDLPLAYRHLAEIDRPLLKPYRPDVPNGRAIVTCAGGGYVLVGSSAGPPNWFANRGYWVFDLAYRLPAGGWRAGPDAAIQDAQQAIRVVRSRASEWGIDPEAIGIAGFSAGGHVAASAATRFDEDLAPPSRTLSRWSARPDFALLACPVITLSMPHRHGGSIRALFDGEPSTAQIERGSPERRVTRRTSPSFIVHAADDRVVSPDNSLMFHAALRQAGVETELHLFARGGHDMGRGFLPGNETSAFPALFTDWLDRRFAGSPSARKS